MDKRLDGHLVAEKILSTVADAVVNECRTPPTVAFVRVGEDGASVSYVRQKQLTASRVGIDGKVFVLNREGTTFETLATLIATLNADANVHGILVQAPVPESISFGAVCNRIVPDKDVDGFGEAHLGRLLQDDCGGFVPCTPAGIVELLKFYNIRPAGKHVVVVNRSLIVGKPLGLLLLRRGEWGDATVTYAHSRTDDLASVTRRADILVTACGSPAMITPHFVKEGAVVVDVGITRIPDVSRPKGYRLCGDVDFEAVYPKVSYIAPVPGGVGPLTVAMLMHNTLVAYRRQHGR
jgi:methylenetetrahydrofolate dehydrogenase (NADP+)/methenyltetrahydrofolate cyclohydrolase